MRRHIGLFAARIRKQVPKGKSSATIRSMMGRGQQGSRNAVWLKRLNMQVPDSSRRRIRVYRIAGKCWGCLAGLRAVGDRWNKTGTKRSLDFSSAVLLRRVPEVKNLEDAVHFAATHCSAKVCRAEWQGWPALCHDPRRPHSIDALNDCDVSFLLTLPLTR